MLQLTNLKKYYASQKAVDDVSFHVPKGSIFGLLGPNGAGKSSILRMITGITMPDEGSILFDNKPFNALKHSQLIGYMPEERGLYKKMKIGEQALYLAQLKGLSKSEALSKINYWFKKLDMQTWWNKKVEDLSKGMSQKLQFVTTVIHEPKLLILDEPFSGLDPVNSEVIKQEIYELSKKGITILFSTHRMEQVEEICEQIVLINKGKVLLDGELKQIKSEFKKHHFLLELNEELKGYHRNIISKSENKYVIQLDEHLTAKEILKYCIDNNIEIQTYYEILPTLNEIFITQVEGNSARTFEKNTN